MKISPKNSSCLALILAVGLTAATIPFALGQTTTSGTAPHALSNAPHGAETIILDTDIGDDIDDAFALSLVWSSPEFDLLGITTAYGDTDLRAQLVDRFLEANCDGGAGGIPVVPGVPTQHQNVFTQAAYAKHQGHFVGGCIAPGNLPDRMKDFPRWDSERKNRDAAGFILRQASEHPNQITLIGIGPLFNIQAAIQKDPATFKKLKRVVIMGGSIDRGYDTATDNKRPPDPEWNIKCDPAGLRALLASGVPVYIMPLDSTQVRLSQHDLEKILAHGSPVTDQLALLYHQWVWGNGVQWTTPTLFDPVAVAYSIRPDLCPTTPMRIEVDDKGFTRRVDGPPNAQVCLKSDETAFRQLLLDRLTSDSAR
jgi:inosine-uridine nucleoside N-ribohydrolase